MKLSLCELCSSFLSILFRIEACIWSDSLGCRIIIYIVAWSMTVIGYCLLSCWVPCGKRHKKCDATNSAVHMHVPLWTASFAVCTSCTSVGLEHCLKGVLCSLHLQVQHSCFRSTTPILIVRLSIVYSTSLRAYFCISFEIVWIELYFLLCIIFLWRTRFVHAHQIWLGVRSGLMFACLSSQQV